MEPFASFHSVVHLFTLKQAIFINNSLPFSTQQPVYSHP